MTRKAYNDIWGIKGVSNDTRRSITNEAKEKDITIGDYLSDIIYPHFKKNCNSINLDDQFIDTLIVKLDTISEMLTHIYDNNTVERLEGAISQLERLVGSGEQLGDNDITRTLIKALEVVISKQ